VWQVAQPAVPGADSPGVALNCSSWRFWEIMLPSAVACSPDDGVVAVPSSFGPEKWQSTQPSPLLLRPFFHSPASAL
jgi:hypothetical protein